MGGLLFTTIKKKNKEKKSLVLTKNEEKYVGDKIFEKN